MSILGRLTDLLPVFRTPSPLPAPTKEQLQRASALVDPGRLMQGWVVWPYNPSHLVGRRGLAIFDIMKRDEQIKAALKFKKHTMLVPGWEVVSPKDQEHDWEVSEFVRHVLQNMEGGFNATIGKVLTALDYGFSCSERLYEEIKGGPFDGKVRLKTVNALKPHYINFVQDEYGKLLAVRQMNVQGSQYDLPPEKFLIYSYGEEFENPYGISDLEAAYRPWWVKENTYKWFAVALERFGMPPLFAFYNPDHYSANEIEDLRRIVTNIQNGTFGIMPRKIKESLELWSQTIGRDSNSTFIQALKRFDEDIAKALLMPGLIGFTSDNAQGSNARSATQFKSFIQVILHLQNEVADKVINCQLIPQLCNLNFPGITSYPRFRFLPFEEDKKMEVVRAWSELVQARIVNRVEDDEGHIRRLFDFPDNPDPELQDLPLPKGSGGMPGAPAAKLDEDTEVVEFGEGKGHPFRGNQHTRHQRVQRALLNFRPVTAEKQRFALAQEERVAKMLNGINVDDNQPMDVTARFAGALHGVEVKTFLDQRNAKVTIHPESLQRKLAWGRKKRAVLHTVVIDARGKFEGGKHAKLFSGHELWYRRGVGSYDLHTMVKVRDAAHLKRLMAEVAKQAA